MELQYLLSVILLDVAVAIKGDATEMCPELVQETGYYSAVNEGTCYMFVNQEKFWKEASSHCLQMGGDLVAIKNVETMRFLMKHLNSGDLGWRNQGVWIGARYYEDKGWRWTTGEQMSYSHWASGEPSKTLGLFSLENCALMRRTDGWRWHDYHCGALKFHYNYICQFPIAHSFQDSSHSAHSATGQHEDNGNMSILLVVIGLAGLVIFGMLVIFFIYRKRQKDKHSHEETIVRFENRSYGPLSQAENGYTYPQHMENNGQRPVSNMYMSPEEVNTLYEEVNKEVNHGVNTLHKDNNLAAAAPPPPPPPRTDSASETSSCDGAVGGEPVEQRPVSSVSEPDNMPLIGATPLASDDESDYKGGNLYVDMKGGSKSSNLDRDSIDKKSNEKEPMYTNTVHLNSETENHYEDLPAHKNDK